MVHLDIEFNEHFQKALNLMENTGDNIFITGKAGTGKSTLLNYFRNTTKKKVVVLAPTGVAALNVNGQTIHSFFRFKPDITVDSVQKFRGALSDLCKAVDTIIIDEISMVRADLLDCVDRCMRLNGKKSNKPFGGTQMIFFGDLYQLAPVVTTNEREILKGNYKTPYFFDSASFQQLNVALLELEKIYRQKDQRFIEILNAIRNNTVTEKELDEINVRVDQTFEPKNDDFYIILTPTNAKALSVNERNLGKLKTRLITFNGTIRGQFDMKQLPTEVNLKVKVGSQVMLVNNDSGGRWVNGSVGVITGIEENKNSKDKYLISVKLADGHVVNVGKNNWEMFRFAYNADTKSLESETIGTFTQYPLKLAWAITIHKSQGKTFDRVVVDMDKGTFAHGQAYVALSRCTSLNGLILKTPVKKKHILMDWRVVKFLTNFQYGLSNKKQSVEEKIELIKKAIERGIKLEITYLKSNDQKSKRIVVPKNIGTQEYMGKEFIGLNAYCCLRSEDRVFRVDRILDIVEVNP